MGHQDDGLVKEVVDQDQVKVPIQILDEVVQCSPGIAPAGIEGIEAKLLGLRVEALSTTVSEFTDMCGVAIN